jgi:ribonuclease P protein component
MLTAAQRLRRREDFAATVRAGRRVGRGALVVHLALAEPAEAPPARTGFVIPKTVGTAVVRNKVRRRLRHLLRDRLGALPPGSRLVVRALPAAGSSGYDKLAGDLDAALAAARQPRARRRPAHG